MSIGGGTPTHRDKMPLDPCVKSTQMSHEQYSASEVTNLTLIS
jgi:hypothetical protein